MNTPIQLTMLLPLLWGPFVLACPPASSSTTTECEEHWYTGVDTRLKPALIGRVQGSDLEKVVGFEIVHGMPLVALSDRLFAFSSKGANQLTLSRPIKSIAVDGTSRLELQTSTGFETFVGSGAKPDVKMSSMVHGKLYGSNSAVLLEIRAQKGLLQFIARDAVGTPFPIVGIKGTLRAASFNEFGLAAVVDNSLYVWKAGAAQVYKYVTDQGLRKTRDVALVGPDRAVISLENSVVLVTARSMIIVTGMHSARCRFEKSLLYLMDGKSGWIWSLQGIDQLGTKKDDQAFARHLLKESVKNPDKHEADFQEAARILGCRDALQELADLQAFSRKSSQASHQVLSEMK